MTRYADMPPVQRALVDRLYDEPHWIGPCGHASPQMWVDEALVIHCAARGAETHLASPLHFEGRCDEPSSGCVVQKCGRTYTAADLP